MSDSYYSMYGDPMRDREDEGVLSGLASYVAEPEQTLPAAFAPRMALGQNPPVTTQAQTAPPPPPPPPPQPAASGGQGGLSSRLGSLGGMGGMCGMGGMFGGAPISNQDSDNVFDSAGNILSDGGDTSDWADVGYTAARLFAGFADGGYVEEPEAFAQGGLVPLAGGGKIAIGPGGGLDDLIPTTIGGSRAAALSDGEFVIPADVVSMMGDGSSNAGARRLYDLVKQ
ncbi:MAG: hypothetical protein ACK5PR_00655, partial [bacterium]